MGAPFLALFGGPPTLLERLRGTTWEYRYARVEPGEEGSVAVFEFVREVGVELPDGRGGEPGA